jgi:hypothetical protein
MTTRTSYVSRSAKSWATSPTSTDMTGKETIGSLPSRTTPSSVLQPLRYGWGVTCPVNSGGDPSKPRLAFPSMGGNVHLVRLE